MNYKQLDSNLVRILGRLEKSFVFSHELKGEKIYKSAVLIRRTSGVVDRIPVIASERQISSLPENILKMKVYFEGYLITNKKGDEDIFAVRIKYNVIPRDITEEDVNFIELDGTIDSFPVIRKALSKNSVCNFWLATKRKYDKVTHVKAVSWGNIAERIYEASRGARICIKGRLQSKIKNGFNEGSINIDDDDYEVAIYYLRMLGGRREQVGEK